MSKDESAAGIAADYPLVERIISEAEEAKRRGLTEDQLFDMLVKLVELEQIKRRRRPIPEPEPQPITDEKPEPHLTVLVKRIIRDHAPPVDIGERRECMRMLSNYLKFPSDNSKSIQLP